MEDDVFPGSGEVVEASGVVLTTGTFLRGVISIGKLIKLFSEQFNLPQHIL